MAESAKERLARILAEKRANAAVPAEPAPVQVEPEPAEPEPTQTEPIQYMTAEGSTHPLALKLYELEEAMDKKLPNRTIMLKEVHDTLKADPAVITLLTDEAIGLIVRGVTEHTGATIIANPKKVTNKRSQPLTLDMLD